MNDPVGDGYTWGFRRRLTRRIADRRAAGRHLRGAASHSGMREGGYKQTVKRRLRFRGTRWARALLALALIGMFVRAATPAGYMFAAGEHRRFLTVTLCAPQGAPATVLDLKTGALIDQKSKPGDGKQKAPDSPCAFALAGALAAPRDVNLALAPFAVSLHAPVGLVVGLRPGLGLVAPPPPARGPPSLMV